MRPAAPRMLAINGRRSGLWNTLVRATPLAAAPSASKRGLASTGASVDSWPVRVLEPLMGGEECTAQQAGRNQNLQALTAPTAAARRSTDCTRHCRWQALVLPASSVQPKLTCFAPSVPSHTVHISGVVAAIAAVPGVAAWVLRHSLPLPVSVVLWHVAGSGFLVAAAATERLAGHTTGLLGKVRRAGDVAAAYVSHPAGYGWIRLNSTLRLPPTACSDHLLPCLPHHALVPPFGLVEVCQCGCCSHVPHLLWRMPLNSMPACTPATAARRWHHRPLTLCPAVAIPRGPACQAGAAAPPVLGALLQPGVRVNVKSAALVGTLTYVGT